MVTYIVHGYVLALTERERERRQTENVYET